TSNKSQTPNPKAESSGQPPETPCSSSPSRVHHRSGGGVDLLLQRLTYKLEQRLRRRIIRQAEVLVSLAVVGFLGREALGRNAALDDGEGESLGLQVAVVDANQGGELGAGGVAHDENPLRIAAVLRDVVVHPADGLGYVAKDGAHFHVGQEAVARGDEDETLVRERLRLDLDVRPVARLPASAVNPEDHWQIFRILRRVDVHFLPWVGWLG